MSIERLQAGAQSATYQIIATSPTTRTRLDETDWAALPNGKLKDVLNRAYLTEAGAIDPDAFIRAFGVAGGLAITTAYYNSANDLGYWLLSEAGVGEPPTKGVPYFESNPPGTNKPFLVRIVTSYSASE